MDDLESHLVGQDVDRTSFWHEIRASVVIDLLSVESPVVADVGAGTGFLGEVLARSHPSARYRFLEPIETLANSLSARYGDEARLHSLAEICEASMVTVLDVIEHVEDDRGFVIEIVQAMSPGARLVLTVPALPFLWSRWDVVLGHHRRYTKRTLAKLFDGLPIGDLRIQYLFPELLPPALIRRVAGGRVGRGEDGNISEFPELPRWLDRLLWSIGSVSSRLRRFWPLGTSLVLTGARTPSLPPSDQLSRGG